MTCRLQFLHGMSETPAFSPNEICSHYWSRIPNLLGGCSKTCWGCLPPPPKLGFILSLYTFMPKVNKKTNEVNEMKWILELLIKYPGLSWLFSLVGISLFYHIVMFQTFHLDQSFILTINNLYKLKNPLHCLHVPD